VRNNRREWFGPLLGTVVFLAGTGVICWTLFQTIELLTKAPQINLGMKSGQAIDFNVVLINFVRLVVRILLLIVLTGIGAVLANRGVKLYAASWPQRWTDLATKDKSTDNIDKDPPVGVGAVEMTSNDKD
jgi:hypothetical protein